MPFYTFCLFPIHLNGVTTVRDRNAGEKNGVRKQEKVRERDNEESVRESESEGQRKLRESESEGQRILGESKTV